MRNRIGNHRSCIACDGRQRSLIVRRTGLAEWDPGKVGVGEHVRHARSKALVEHAGGRSDASLVVALNGDGGSSVALAAGACVVHQVKLQGRHAVPRVVAKDSIDGAGEITQGAQVSLEVAAAGEVVALTVRVRPGAK